MRACGERFRVEITCACHVYTYGVVRCIRISVIEVSISSLKVVRPQTARLQNWRLLNLSHLLGPQRTPSESWRLVAHKTAFRRSSYMKLRHQVRHRQALGPARASASPIPGRRRFRFVSRIGRPLTLYPCSRRDSSAQPRLHLRFRRPRSHPTSPHRCSRPARPSAAACAPGCRRVRPHCPPS